MLTTFSGQTYVVGILSAGTDFNHENVLFRNIGLSQMVNLTYKPYFDFVSRAAK